MNRVTEYQPKPDQVAAQKAALAAMPVVDIRLLVLMLIRALAASQIHRHIQK